MADTVTEPRDIHTPEVLPPSVLDGTQPAQPDNQPTRRPVGRPRNDGLPAGSLKNVSKGPAPGEDGGADPDFFTWLKSLPASDWNEQLILYLYRTHPFINLGRKGEWRIERFNRPVDVQEIMEVHGSGGYKILLDRWNPLTSQTIIVRTHYFTIMNMQYPPKVPLGDWINRPENKDWLWAKGAIEQQMLKTGAANGSGGAEGDLFRAAVAAVKELRPDVSNEEQTNLTRMVIETMKDANKQMLERANPAQTLELVNTVISAVAGKGNTEGSALMTLVTGQLANMSHELAEERKFNREILAKMAAAPAAAASPLKSQMTEFKETAELLGLTRGGGSTKTDWGEVAVEVGKEVIKSLTVLGNAIITRQPAKPQPARPATAATIDAHAQIAAPAPAPAPGQVEPAAPEEAMNTIQQLSNQFGGLFDTAAPFLVDQYVKGFSGMEFREWFRETYGTYTYNAMRGMDPRTIHGVIELRKTQAPEHVQDLLAQLQPPEQVLEFITEFLSDTPVDQGDDDPEPQIVPPPPTPIRKRPAKEDTTQPPAASPFSDPNAHQEF